MLRVSWATVRVEGVSGVKRFSWATRGRIHGEGGNGKAALTFNNFHFFRKAIPS